MIKDTDTSGGMQCPFAVKQQGTNIPIVSSV